MNEKKLVPILCGLRNGELCLKKGGCVFQTADGKCAPAVGKDLSPKTMKVFYCVQQRYYDNGKVSVCVYSLEAEEKPKMWGRSEIDCDLWLDFFDTLEEAEASLGLYLKVSL